MGTNFVPHRDGAFDTWQRGFAGYVTEHFHELGLSVEEVTRLKDVALPWDEAYAAHWAAREAAKAARVVKVERRAAYERVIRELVRRIQAGESVTDAQRAALHITVRDTEPTPVGAPTTRPLVVVDFSERLRHTLRWFDESTPTSRARPRGVMGVEVRARVAALADPPPSDPDDLRYLLMCTRPPAVVEYDGADGGLTAHYMLRWLSTRGEAGPWSETASATIGA